MSDNRKSKLTKWQQFKLRLKLLQIWFIKNIFVFVWILFIVGLGLACGGYITKDTPILGTIFGSVSEDVAAAISQSGGNITVYSVIESIITIGFAFAICAAKLKRLGIKDIKSRKVKVLLIQAGLYFNEDGKLTKRVETITNTDINGDGKIGDMPTDATSENIFQSIKRAGEEFVTIVKLDLSEVEEDKKEEAYEAVGLEETKEAIDNIIVDTTKDTASLFDPDSKDENEEVANSDVTIKEKKKNIFKRLFGSAKNFVGDIVSDYKMSRDLEKTDKELTKEEKQEKIKKSSKKKLKENYEKVTEEKTDNSVSNITEIETPVIDINLNETAEVETPEIVEEKTEKEIPVVNVNINVTNINTKMTANETHNYRSDSSQSALDDFLANLKKNKK